MRARTAVRLVAFIALLSLCAFVFFGFTINLPGQLERARGQWQAKKIDSYQIRYTFGSLSTIGGVWVTVIDGEVVGLSAAKPFDRDMLPANATPITSTPEWYLANYAPVFPPDLSHYSVTGLMDFWETVQKENPLPLLRICSPNGYAVTFNAEYGYIERLAHTDCPEWDIGLGLACTRIAYCSVKVRVTAFQPLDG